MTSTRRRTERTPLPAWVKPRLAALVKKAPDGPDWLHEMKLDGYRMHARLDAGRVKILTRRGNDWTQKYPIITKAIAGLPAQNAYLDGELCGVLPDGKTAFNLIQNATDAGAAANDCRQRLHLPIVGMIIDIEAVLVFEASAQPLDEDVVHAPALAVHTDGDPVILQRAGEILAGELAALVGIEDLGPAVSAERLLERLDTK